MAMSMARLLIHSDDVPREARDALSAAERAQSERRLRLLESAAFVLHREVGVDCRDARELVGLEPGDCAG
jgi:hypothetical protein